MSFSYEKYKESDSAKKLKEELDKLETAGSPTWNGGSYKNQLDSAFKAIAERKPFNYNLSDDPLYRQHKDKYLSLGKLAMEDTVGRAASLTGGYGNSYAVTAGNQAYNQYLTELSDIIPELYEIAYERYSAEGDDLERIYDMISDRYDGEYKEYLDRSEKYDEERKYLSDEYQKELDRSYDIYSSDKDLAYKDYRDTAKDSQWQKEFDEAIRQYTEKLEYEKYRDSIEDSRWEKEFALKLEKQSEKEEEEEKGKEYYFQWDAGEWEGYFSKYRLKHGVTAALEELDRMNSLGFIPKKFMVYASSGARGGSSGH